MKRVLLLLSICFSLTASAQRDINHWQLSALGGGFYFNENIANSFDDVDEPGFYSLGLRIQKKLGADFQIGLSFLENRMREDFDVAVRTTDLHLTYNWDNGYLLSQRAIISPYHLIGVGFRSRGRTDDINLEDTRGQFTLENGIKVRLGDNWSTQVSFVVNWNSDNQQFEDVFDSGYNYGGQVGISYHFGQVKTKYNGPVFNAGRDYIGNDRAYSDLFEDYAYVALRANTARDLGAMSQVTIDSLRAKRDFTVYAGPTISKEIYRNDRVFQLIAKTGVLDSLYAERYDIYKISLSDLKLLISPEETTKEKEEEKPKATKAKEADELVDKQNRLIENQNAFIKLMLEAGLSSAADSSINRPSQAVDSTFAQTKTKSLDSAKFYSSNEDALSTEDSLTLMRLTKVDSARVLLREDAINGQLRDSVFIYRSVDTASVVSMQRRINRIEEENERLKRESDGEAAMDERSSDEEGIARGKENSKEIEELEKRMAALEAENRDLKSKTDVEKQKEAPSEEDQALLEENKRRNDLLEDQISATQKLAEKSAEPTEIVIDDNRQNDRGGVNLQPGVVVPIGGRGSKKDNEAVLENQEKMQARLDSMSREISELKKSQQTQNNVMIAQNSGAVDSTLSDTTGFIVPVDTSAISEESFPVDSLIQNDTYEVDRQDLNEPDVELKETNLVDTNAVERADTTKSNPEVNEKADSDSLPSVVEPKMDFPVSVYFGLNSSSVSGENQNKLDGVVEDLQNLSDRTVVLEGHTDKSGNASYNEMLSNRRAEAVKDYFENKGIDQSRISIKPLGSQQADEQYNESSRRVDVKIK